MKILEIDNLGIAIDEIVAVARIFEGTQDSYEVFLRGGHKFVIPYSSDTADALASFFPSKRKPMRIDQSSLEKAGN